VSGASCGLLSSTHLISRASGQTPRDGSRVDISFAGECLQTARLGAAAAASATFLTLAMTLIANAIR